MGRLFKDADMPRSMQFCQKAIDLNLMAGRQSAAASLTKECA